MKGLYFPVFMDLSEKKIVVIGGGKIAQRRVETLCAFTENIWVTAPEITEELQNFAANGKIIWMKETYNPNQLQDADMVLAATDDVQCNEQIVSDCRKRGILVNTAHRKELCDFYFPAVVRRGNVVAGVTASGVSHKSAKRARQCIERALTELPPFEEYPKRP